MQRVANKFFRSLAVGWIGLLVAWGCGSGGDSASLPPVVAEAIDRGEHYWSLGDYSGAEKRFRSGLEDGDRFDLRYRVAVLRLVQQKEDAEDELLRAISLDPRHVGPRFFHAMFRADINDFAGQGVALESALRLQADRLNEGLADPEAARPALTALENLQYREATRFWDHYLKDQPQDGRGWTLLARAQLGIGAWKEAEEAASRALELDASLIDALAMRAAATVRIEEDAAAPLTIQILERDPHHALAHDLQGLLAVRQSTFRQATRSFLRAVLADPLDPLYHQHLGEAFLSMDQREQGAVHLDYSHKLRAYLTRRGL